MKKLNIGQFKLIFWDFDGVIKDSVGVKTDAFIELFKPYGDDICRRIFNHNATNGGMSRFEKIPLYLQWSNETVDDEKIEKFCKKFSSLVEKKVIDSSWVPGVENYLRNDEYAQTFVVISGTPQDELIRIISALEFTGCFN